MHAQFEKESDLRKEKQLSPKMHTQPSVKHFQKRPYLAQPS